MTIKNEFITRDHVLKLLSNEEIARVSNAETATHLASGDEYVDLERLDCGVQRVNGTPAAMSSALPKLEVHSDTWRKITTLLSSAANRPRP